MPTGGHHEIELMMATWTPGSYLIREYERHVENVAATREVQRGTSGGEDGKESLGGHDGWRCDRGCHVAGVQAGKCPYGPTGSKLTMR